MMDVFLLVDGDSRYRHHLRPNFHPQYLCYSGREQVRQKSKRRCEQTFKLIGIRTATAKTEHVANNMNDILKKLSNYGLWVSMWNWSDTHETNSQRQHPVLRFVEWCIQTSVWWEGSSRRRPGVRAPREEKMLGAHK